MVYKHYFSYMTTYASKVRAKNRKEGKGKERGKSWDAVWRPTVTVRACNHADLYISGVIDFTSLNPGPPLIQLCDKGSAVSIPSSVQGQSRGPKRIFVQFWLKNRNRRFWVIFLQRFLFQADRGEPGCVVPSNRLNRPWLYEHAVQAVVYVLCLT